MLISRRFTQPFWHTIARILKRGEARYADWVKFSGPDETQSYYLQSATHANKSKQSFEWVNFLFQFLKEDKEAFFYKVETLFPVESVSYKSVESMLFFVESPLCSFIRCNLSCSGSDRAEQQIGHLKVSKIILTNPE